MGCFAPGLEQLVVLLLAGLGFADPAPGEFAVLDFLEHLFHLGADRLVDDARPGHDVAVLGGFGNGEAHAGNTRLVHEVDDELELVQALEVGHLGLVPGCDERVVAGLDQRAGAAAEHGLFAEEIGLGLFLEAGLDHARARAADALGPGERDFLRLLARVLVNGDQRRHAAAFLVLAADEMARALRRDHDHVDVLRRLDRLEVDGEAVGEEERLALLEIRLDVLLVNARDGDVGHGDENDVGFLHRLGGGQHLEAEFLRRRESTCCRDKGR